MIFFLKPLYNVKIIRVGLLHTPRTQISSACFQIAPANDVLLTPCPSVHPSARMWQHPTHRALLFSLILIHGIADARAVQQHLSPNCATALATGNVHRQRGFASPALVTALRRDLRELAPGFRPSASFSSNGVQDDLRAALTCRPNMESDAFSILYSQLDEVRAELEGMIGRGLSTGIEATYVIYPQGGFYKRHMDSLEGVDPGGSGRRAVSFICYLVDPAEPKWSSSDGGELRVYHGEAEVARGDARALEDSEATREDVLPESGLLVLFDSKRVWHEVRPTQRERACLVGWFREQG